MAGRGFYYKLDEGRPVPCSWYEAGVLLADFRGRTVCYDILSTGFRVSTSFLVFDHNPFGPSPVLFNTIATATDGTERVLGRYRTLAEAKRGHEQALSFLRLVACGNA